MSGKVGRPTKYRPEFCEKVIECGREGDGIAAMARELDVCIKTVYNWQEEHPEFLQAIARAKDLALAWWKDQGKAGIWEEKGRRFNASAYRLQMMNRFGWGEKSDHEHKMSGRDLAQQISAALDEIEESVSE